MFKAENIWVFIVGAVVGALVTFGVTSYLHNSAQKQEMAATQPQPGAPANAAQQPKNAVHWYTKVSNGSWKVRCRSDVPTAGAANTCLGLLEVVNMKNHQLLMTWMIGQNKSGGLSMMMQTPTGVALTPGLDLTIDSGTPHHFAFANCGAGACQVSSAMDSALLAELAKANKAAAKLTLANGQQATITMTVNGAGQTLADLGYTAPAAP